MKRSFCSLLFLLASLVLHAEVNLWSSDFHLDLEPGISFSLENDCRNRETNFYLKGFYGSPVLSVDSGLNYQNRTVDVVTGLHYGPEFFNRFYAGVAARYHFLGYQDIFTEHDILVGAFYRNKSRGCFNFLGEINYLSKTAVINSISDYVPYIHNNSMSVNFSFDWKFVNTYEFFWNMGTTSYFDYLLFATPIIHTGFIYHVNRRISAGSDFTFKLTDAFTVSESFSQIKAGFFCRVGAL